MSAVKEQPVPSPAALQVVASTIGYDVLLDALHRSLCLLVAFLRPLWPDAQRKTVKLFVHAFSFSPLAADACLGGGIFVGTPSIGCHPSHSRFI